MSGILAAAAPRMDQAPGPGTGDTRPAPGILSTVAAGFNVAYDEIGDVQENRLDDAYLPVVQDLAEATGKEALDYRPSFLTQAVNPFDGRIFDADRVWKDIAAARAKDPKAYADLGTREEFERGVLRRGSGRDADLETLARGNGIAGFVGALPAAFRDPFNLATLPIGGVGRTAAGKILSEGLVNAGIEALQTPAFIANKSALGEDTGAGEIALNIGAAGFGGAAIRGTAIGGKAIGTRAIDTLAPGYRIAREAARIEIGKASDAEIFRAFNDAVPAEYRTPGEEAAMSVLRRAIEIDEANPFPNTYAGKAAHEERLARAAAQLDNPVRRSGGSLNSDIVEGLMERGLSREAARGIAAGVHAESRSDPNAVNPTSGAHGIGQWLGSRQDELFKRYGRKPNLQQQLDFLVWELRGGDHAGKKVLAQSDETAVLDSYIRDFMRPAPGMETDGDLQRGMAALGRDGEAPAGRYEVGDDELVDGPAVARPEALDAERPIVAADGRPIPLQAFRAADIGVDADLMQFKSGGDQFGVTDRLQGVTQWDPMAAGMVTVWEGADGRRLIADGHQRLGLAKRIMAQDPAQDIHVNAFVLREADGFTAQDARILTALKNIGEGTGAAADAAKVFREAGLAAEEALAKRLPPRSALVRDGKALSRLSDPAFGAIINDVIPEHYGAAIGHLVDDPDKHMAMVELLAQLDPPNRAQAEGILRQALEAGFTRATQDELFGSREMVSAIFAQKAKVTERVKAEIRKMKGAFAVAARNADALEGAGNTIARDASAAAAKANAEALALLDNLAYRTGNDVSEILTNAARRLAEGEPIAGVVRDAVDQIRQIDLAAAVRSAGNAGDGAGRGGRGGFADGEDPAAPGSASLDDLDPATRDELEAAGQLGFIDDTAHEAFDDPAGAGVAAAADSIRHDIEADLRAAEPTREIPEYERAAEAGRPAAPVDERADLDTILQHANVNQAELAALGRELEGDGAIWHDPGPKSAARITEKVENEGYGGAHELKDIARGAISIVRPEQADEILAALRARFPDVHDKGWQLIPASGYFDRKLVVTFEGGGRAELQIASQGLWDAKKKGGQDLYNRARSLPKGNAERDALNAQQRELYAAALAGTEFEGMASSLASGKRSASSAGSTGTPSSSALPTSAGASRQIPPSAKAQALPAASSTATRRSSISNSDNFMENPPWDKDSISDNADPVNVKGENVDPNVADRQRQEMQLRAQAPLRGGNRTGQAQDGTMGLGLFDEANAPTFDLGDGLGERSAADIFRELDEETADLDTLRNCGLPGMGGDA